MRASRPLAVVGNVNVDLILGPCAPWPEPGTEVMVEHDDLRVGGAAGNTALAWAALGQPHQIFANVGRDAFGAWLKDGFGERANGWITEDASTTLSVGITHPNGERTFLTTTGHLPRLSWASLEGMMDGEALSGGLLLVCGSFLTNSLTGDYGKLFDWADRHEVEIALDTGWPLEGWTREVREMVRAWLPRCRYLLLNEVETRSLAETENVGEGLDRLQTQLKLGGTAVAKLGANGAMAKAAEGEPIRRPAPKVSVIDTIGAGDVFNAGFLLGIATGQDLARAVDGGIALASRAVSTAPRRYEFGEPQ
ncbi:carbohydrate kinase family protein [Jiella marina]|uniref:carbohydrate kinase family protein n=1 Tax=Jiella sp. LLJ827 TaxID=2917712 RepID=UPI002101A8F0|nr:carbohydrate kinase family protein [Jiella sp. LLJ827]MCQ0986304.1 carbohydrate kinase family protein [Jiella sp. LLJ827]